jgi:hypothetical protein
MCTNDKPKSNTNNQTQKEKNVKVTTSNSKQENSIFNIKQSSDYSSLFNQKNDICLTISDVAKATNLPISSINEGEKFNKLYCYFDIKLPNGSLMKYSYTATEYGKNYDMKKELEDLEKDKAYKKKHLGMFTEISETGDTYLVHNRLRGELRIMNPNYDYIILTKYASVQEKLTKEQKNLRDQYATKIANYLLQKHKK